MAHEPKLEVFKISLKPKAKVDDNFKTFFSLLENESDPEVLSQNDLNNSFKAFFKTMVETIDASCYKSPRIKKGLSLDVQDSITGTNKTIIYNSENQTIRGTLKGGRYGKNRSIGDVDNPVTAHSPITDKNIVYDTFYFLLYTPFGSKKGILMLQSYTDDTINDVFSAWLRDLMSNQYFFQPSISTYCPSRIQNEFRETSVVKEISFTEEIVLNNIEDPDNIIDTKNFSINISITAKDSGERTSHLPALKEMLKKFTFNRPQKETPLLNFKKKVGRLSNGSHQSSFELDSDFDIRPTIFLKDRIKLEKDGSPNWKSLEEFCLSLLEEIKPEIYPENEVS